MLILSILTPSVPSRLAQLGLLCAELARQIGTFPVEHLTLLDNKKRSVGLKRDALLRAARGRYVAFVDDDDWIAPDYVSSLLRAADRLPDVITFRQSSTVNGQQGEIEFRLGNPNDPFRPGGMARRNAWHVCAWRRNLAILSTFPDFSYGEDWSFAAPLCLLPGLHSEHIDKVLHFYRHSAATTEAPPP
jgi:hypothetical protein